MKSVATKLIAFQTKLQTVRNMCPHPVFFQMCCHLHALSLPLPHHHNSVVSFCTRRILLESFTAEHLKIMLMFLSFDVCEPLHWNPGSNYALLRYLCLQAWLNLLIMMLFVQGACAYFTKQVHCAQNCNQRFKTIRSDHQKLGVWATGIVSMMLQFIWCFVFCRSQCCCPTPLLKKLDCSRGSSLGTDFKLCKKCKHNNKTENRFSLFANKSCGAISKSVSVYTNVHASVCTLCWEVCCALCSRQYSLKQFKICLEHSRIQVPDMENWSLGFLARSLCLRMDWLWSPIRVNDSWKN